MAIPERDPFPFAGHRHPAIDPDSLAPASLPPSALLAEARRGSWSARLVLAAVGVNLFALGLAVGLGLDRLIESEAPLTEPAVLAPALPSEVATVPSRSSAGAPESSGAAEAPDAAADVPDPSSGATAASDASAAAPEETRPDPGLATVPVLPEAPSERRAKAPAPAEPAPEPAPAQGATWGPFEARPVPAPVQDRRKLLPLGRRR